MVDTPRAQAIKKRIEQLQVRLADIEKRNSKVERAADTRRKVILGGWMIERARTDETAHRRMVEIIASLTRKQDIAAFRDWELIRE